MKGDPPGLPAAVRPPALPWLSAVASGLLVLATLAAYFNSLHGPFVFDDRAAILDNASIRDLGSIGNVLSPPADGRGVSGRPLVNLTLAINFRLGGFDPLGYHAFNLAVHVLAGLALFGLVRRTLRLRSGQAPGWETAGRGPRTPPTLAERRDPAAGVSALAAIPPDRADSRWIAFTVALLWLLHPLQTESVTCIVQRTESLCGLFYLLTLYCFVRGVESPRAGLWFGFSIAAGYLGMVTKEVMVTAPLLVLLYDRTFLAGGFAAAWRQRRGFYLALGSSWLLLAWLVLAGGGTRGTAAGLSVGVSPWAYLLQQCEAIVLYLKLSFWPHPLVLDYGTAVASSVAAVWWQGIGVLALLAATLWALWRRPVAGFVGAWFFVILAPSSSIVPLAAQTMAEHRMYLPLAAVIAAAVVGMKALAGRRVLIGFFLLAVVAGGMTHRRNAVFQGELVLWSDTTANYPANPRAWLNLGGVLMDLDRVPEAAAAYEKAEALQPNSPHLQANLCLADARLGRLAEAVAHGEAALQLDPDYANAHVNLGYALARLGRLDEAVGHYQTALRLQPGALDLQVSLADTLLDLGRAAEAVPHYEAALPLASRRAEIHCKLAKAFSQQGDLEQARAHCAEALRLAPDYAEALFVWGNLCATAKDFLPAIAAYRRAAALDPGYVAARNNLANALLVTRHLDEAIAEYREVLRLRPTDRSVRENLDLALKMQAEARR